MTGTNAFSIAFERNEIDREQCVRGLHQSVLPVLASSFVLQQEKSPHKIFNVHLGIQESWFKPILTAGK